MNDDFISIVKGALLHDIGKVIQRASDNPTSKKHTEWGYEWLRDNLDDKIAVNAPIAHHYTKDDDYVFTSNMGLIWYQSDNLSSYERKGVEKEKLEEGEWHSKIAIASPFSRVRNPNNPDEKSPLVFLPLKRIDDDIPKALEQEPPITKKDYYNLWEGFKKDFHNQEVQKPHSIDFLLMLFEKHFSRVPSITMRIYDGLKKEEIKEKHPDISLHDHSKLTAAIAGCMYHYCKEIYPDKWNNNELLKDEILNVPSDINPYLLIGGDISGVQKFIYTITSKGALKSLKGRSFFLELLSEHIVSELLKELNLTRCNLIFSGGGHFYILSHNTPLSEKSIKTIKGGIDDYLFEEFKGNLQLHLEAESFHPQEFKDASKIWNRLSEKIEISKKTKWKDKLQDVLNVQMPHNDFLTSYCEVCFREDVPSCEVKIDEDILTVCNSCKSQYTLGNDLKKIADDKFSVIYRFDIEPKEYTIRIGNAYYLFKSGWEKTLHEDAITVYRINDFTSKHYSHPQSIYLPIGIYQHKSLHELSDASSVYGISRIAVLRMDVDNLGKIFSHAVNQEDRTFSRMASISKGLNNFFKFHLNDVVEGKGIAADIGERDIIRKGRLLSVAYSGGDDLFLIGHWLDITEAAFDTHDYFRKYTGNPFITISGGIAVNHDKYPVYQYARNAKEAEELAKSDSKNAITLFGNRVFKWDDAGKVLDRVRLFKQFLVTKKDHLAIDEEKLPKTFFYRLLALARKFQDDGTLILPKAAYLISRAKIDKCNPEDILKLKGVIMNNNQNEWRITETAAMWMLMLMRKGGEENAGK